MTYSNVRPETHGARVFLVLALAEHHPEVVDLWEDGSDLILVTLRDGREVMIHLLDGALTAGELRRMQADDRRAGYASLFMFWADMLLPGEGQRFVPADWMHELLSESGGYLYGYERIGPEIYIFPVYFDAQAGSTAYYVRWGQTVQVARLHIEHNNNGKGHFANFQAAERDHTERARQIPPDATPQELQAHYALLALSPEATPKEIRQAYRQRARELHPDLNTETDTTADMQVLNRAYQQLMAQFTD
ncbi:MAG: J domain-containing protein [Anaerolineales bacterium]